MAKFIKKYILLFLLAVVILVSILYRVTAFKSTNGGDLIKDAKSKTVVNFYIKADADSDARQYEVDKFNKDNNSIYINLQIYGKDYNNIIKTDLANEGKVDIFQFGYSDAFRYNHVLNLEKLGLNKEDMDKNNIMNYNGKAVGIKTTGNTAKLVWNKEIVKNAGINPDKIPTTYEELLEDLRKIKKYDSSIVPFEIPANNYDDLRVSVGLPSVNKDNVYTTFWNYKDGKYDFNPSKSILTTYNIMYKEGLIEKNLKASDDFSIRKDFYTGKAAVILSTYKDRSYFTELMPLNFNVSIGDVPQTGENPKYYYVGAYDCFLVNKDTKHKKAVAEVLKWLLSESVNKEIDETGRTLSTVVKNPNTKNKLYSEYSVNSNYNNELYDPTPFAYYDRTVTENLIYDAIKGNKTVEAAVNQLNQNYSNYCKISKEQVDFDFSKYVEK